MKSTVGTCTQLSEIAPSCQELRKMNSTVGSFANCHKLRPLSEIVRNCQNLRPTVGTCTQLSEIAPTVRNCTQLSEFSLNRWNFPSVFSQALKPHSFFPGRKIHRNKFFHRSVGIAVAVAPFHRQIVKIFHIPAAPVAPDWA